MICYSSDHVGNLLHSHSDKKMMVNSKVSHSSLFNRLRRGQLGSSRTKISTDEAPDHRLSLVVDDQADTRPDTCLPRDESSARVQQQGSQSCPSSPSSRRRRSKKWKNVFKSKPGR